MNITIPWWAYRLAIWLQTSFMDDPAWLALIFC